jgi:NADP-reducing hydrogenase subunit HndB
MRKKGGRMAPVATRDLTARRKQAKEHWQQKINADLYITVGMGTCGLAAGAQETLAAIEEELERRNLNATISQVGCVGMCSYEPMLELQTKGGPHFNYGNATSENVPEIFASYFDGTPLHNSVIVGEVTPTITQTNGHALHSLSFVNPDNQDKM